MKNSTFSAQVANNLLTLLQGYSKTIRLLLIMFLTLTASTAWGETLTLNNLGASLTSTSNSTISTTTITATGNNTSSYVINYLQCKKQTYSSSHAMLLAKSTGAFISNKTAMPGNIKSVTVYVLTNAASKTTYHCAFSTTECTSAYTTGSTAVNITGGSSNKYTCTVSNAKYFCISLGNTNNGQVYKLDVEYEVDTPPSCTTNPTVSAGSSSNVAATTATVSCSGGITSLGSAGCSIESYGFVYGTSSNPTISNSKVQVGTTYTTTGTAFTKELTGLTANTTYYVRPYATNGNGTAYGTQTSFKTLELPKYTVTLNAGPGTCAAYVTETSAGAGVTLPTPTLDCGNWEFAGWATSAVATETSSKPATLLTGTYKPSNNITLYAVYQRTEEAESNGSETEVTKSVSISEYATANSWTNDTKYTSVTIDENITATASTGTNTGKYYTSGTNWRFYQTEKATLTLSAATGCTIKTIKVTYSVSNTGTLTYSGSNVASNTATTINATSATFGVENTGSATNGQVRITAISVTYTTTSAGGTITTTYYHSTPDCGGTPEQPTYTITISNDIQNGTIVADKSSAAEGETVKLTVTPEAGYKLDAITVTKATGGIVEVENKTFTMPASNVTVSATFTEIPKYTVSFSTGTGNSTQADISETVGGAGITLPDGPTPNCSGEGWEFFVWSTNNVQDLMTTAPSSLLYAGHTYKPQTNNTTLYAVYSKTESDGSGGTTATVTLTNDEIDAAYVGNGDNKTTSYGNHTIVSASGTWGGRIIIGNESSIKYVGISANDDNRHLASPIFSANITNITIRGRHNASKTRNIYICSSDEEAQPTTGDLGVGSIASSGVQNQFTDWTDVSITVSGNHTQFYVYADGGLQIHSIVVTTGGSTTTTYYHSNPCDDSEPITPTWGKVTINHSSIQVVCGSKTLLNAADPNGPATISFSGTDLVNPVTVTASDGFLVSTNKTVEHTYQSEITINPHKEGQNIGKLQNVYVIAQASAQSGDFTGTITLTGADITGGTQTIDVTAAVTCTQYTITWSVSGDTEMIEPTTFYAGDEWDLPENPDFDCNGREFVGWTTSEIIGETPNAPDDLYKSKGNFPEINEDKTFYAVFATSSGDDSNETTVSVSIKNYAETNSWTNATQYNTINISSHITAAAEGNANTGKYYENGADWRLYQTESPTLTFKAQDGCNILSITITYTIDKTGILTFNGSNIASDTPCEINASSAEFGVGNTGDATNGQVRITSISVTYSGGGGGYSGYATNCNPCDNSNFTISESNFTISKDSILNLGALIQTENQSTIIYTCNTPNGTITADGLFSATESGTYTVTIHQDSDDQDHCAVNKTITIKVVGEIVTLKWSVNGATNTNLSPGTVEKNTPIGTLPVPKTGCDDKQFMGWTTTSTVNNDGSDIEYIKPTTTPTENTTYYAVFASEGNQNSEDLEEIFNESFDNINGQGGNDEQWNSTDNNKVGAGTNAIDSLIANHSWSITKGYEANQCVKMGSSKEKGIITTPAINQLNGDAVLTFKAGAWDNQDEKLDIIIEVSEGATISPSAFTLTKGVFNTYTANITGGTNETKITIQAKDASKNRFFIDDIRIAAGTISFEDYTTRCGTYTVTYHGFGGYSTICGDNPAEKVVEVGSTFTVATCTPEDPKGLGRIFAGEWYTNPNGKGDTYKPGDTFVVEEDVVLYAKWTLNTNTAPLPVDDENKDLATTDIVVTGGNTLTLQAGTTTINSLTLKGGLQEGGAYAMPVINIPEGATLVRNNNKINLDLTVNNQSYYPFAVPFRAKNGSDKANWDYVGYIDPDLKDAATYRTHFVIKTYDGAKRAENGENRDANWVIVNRDTYLEPGKGYIISAMTYPDKDTATIRIPMNVDNAWLANGEQKSITVKEQTTTRDTVAVTAHTGKATDINNGGHQRHAGWNFVANPYLANFAGTNASNEGGSFINGEILINQGDYDYGGDNVPYVTIPAYDFAHYDQVKLSDATLSPAYSFFVQVGTDGTMTFKTAGRQQAPAGLAARNAEERLVKMDVDITLSDNHSSDQTGIIISDRYSDAYEIGRDLEKLFGSAYNLSVYTLMADNTPLAFQALAIRSNMQVIPVGYRAPEQGEYTFRLNEATSSIDLLNEQYEQLVLVDYQTGELTNLLISDYTFYSERTQADNRFAIYAVPRQNAPTDLPNAIGQDKEAQKIIHNGHLYILRDGNVYNGNGQIVK